MSQAVTCPVCGGSGKYQTGTVPGGANPTFQACHGCNGKGWVEVSGCSPPPYVPAHPPYQPWITYGDRLTNGSLYGIGLNTSAAEFHQA